MYFGLDVHKEFIQVCRLSEDGKTRKDYRIRSRSDEIRKFSEELTAKDKVVLEATFHTWAIHQILCESSATIVVANAHEVHLIAKARVKTDKVDAHVLAQLLRADFIPEVKLPSEEVWQVRQLISHRRLLGKERTAIKNSIWGVLNKKLIVYPFSDLFSKKGKKWLATLTSFSKIERLMLDNDFAVLDQIETSMEAADEALRDIARSDARIPLMLTIPGIDVVTAVGILAVIEDVERFGNPNHLASYFGLTPTIRQSADKTYRGGITKRGNAYGRWLAIEAAQSLALSNTPITASYHKIKQKKGHNVAVTALARKLIVLIWHMLKKNEPYRYAPPARTREKLRKLNSSLPPKDRNWVAKRPIEEVLVESGIKLPAQATAAEMRTAKSNKATVTRAKNLKLKSFQTNGEYQNIPCRNS